MRSRLRTTVVALSLAVAVLATGTADGRQAQPAPEGVDPRPNIVLIYTDDQTLQQMQALEQTRNLLGESGLTFSNSVVSYPLCCPSRATLFTGQYSQNNGVRGNGDATDANPLPQESVGATELDAADLERAESEGQGVRPEAWAAFANDAESRSLALALQQSGYRTGLLGKYLNGYDLSTIPPGWDDWRVEGRSVGERWGYWSTRMNVNGVVSEHEGFQTDLYAGMAEDMLDDAAVGPSPFFLTFGFSAPHVAYDGQPTYPERHADAFADEQAPRTAAFNEADVSDKPNWPSRIFPTMDDEAIARVDERWRAGLRSLRAVDEAVARIVARLEALGELDNTMLIFTSDNGYYYGEHRIEGDKYLAYESAARVPLIISGPAVSNPLRGTSVAAPVANIDLAPTILDLADAAPLTSPDGRSLVPLLTGEGTSTWSGRGGLWTPRRYRARPILLMGVRGDWIGRYQVTYSGVRAGGWSYVRYETTSAVNEELYDLRADPLQLENLVNDPAHQATRRRLERQRHLLVRCAALSCDVPPYGYLDLPRTGPRPAWFEAAQWADSHSLGAAYEDGTFRPAAPMRRDHLAMWLWRSAGSPRGVRHQFADVPRRLDGAVRWLVARGVVNGERRRFRPAANLTRQNATLWLWRLAGSPRAGGALPRDVAATTGLAPAVRWLVADPRGHQGPIATDYSGGRFLPDRVLRRRSAVLWVQAAAQRTVCGGRPVTVDLGAGDVATSGPDVILGTTAADTIDGLNGDDVVCGLRGDDVIRGGSGRDQLRGGFGNDRLRGGLNIDFCAGGVGVDAHDGGCERLRGVP